jgi:hypothetical protein
MVAEVVGGTMKAAVDSSLVVGVPGDSVPVDGVGSMESGVAVSTAWPEVEDDPTGAVMLALCGRVSPQSTVFIESCHSTWEFDPNRSRYRRVPTGGRFDTAVPWREYTRVVLHEDDESMEIYLPGGQRVLRTWRHLGACSSCGRGTTELSLVAIAAHPATQ